VFTPQDPRTFPSNSLQSAIVGTAKVGKRLTYFTPILVGVQVRRKVDVGKHPGIIGKSKVGPVDTIRGNPTIFRHRPGFGQERMVYYQPTNRQTEAQQAWRAVFAAAVSAWQALSASERQAWRVRGSRRAKMGYSMFLTQYLEQHR